MNSTSQKGVTAHDFMQPLNVIQLASGNIRARVMPTLAPAEAEYLGAKLEGIERQVARLAEMAAALRSSTVTASDADQ